MLCDQVRHRFVEGSLGVVKALELGQRLQKAAPFAGACSHREENQNRVIAGARNLHPPPIKELGKDRPRNAKVRPLPCAVMPGIRIVTFVGSSMQ